MDLFNKLFGKTMKRLEGIVDTDNLNELGEEINRLNDNIEDLTNKYVYTNYIISKIDCPDVHTCCVRVHVPGFTKEDIQVTTEQLENGIEICIVAERKIENNSTRYEYKAVVNKGTPEQFKARLKDNWVIVEYIAKTSGKNKLEIE